MIEATWVLMIRPLHEEQANSPQRRCEALHLGPRMALGLRQGAKTLTDLAG